MLSQISDSRHTPSGRLTSLGQRPDNTTQTTANTHITADHLRYTQLERSGRHKWSGTRGLLWSATSVPSHGVSPSVRRSPLTADCRRPCRPVPRPPLSLRQASSRYVWLRFLPRGSLSSPRDAAAQSKHTLRQSTPPGGMLSVVIVELTSP